MDKKVLLIDDVKYNEWTDLRETEDLEPMIQEHANHIFGENALYIDRKQKLRSLAGTGSIPDAYVISLDGNLPHWHIVEIELSYKDPGRHLVTQINDFINGMKNSRNEIVSAINQWIKSNEVRALEFKRNSHCEDIHEFLSDLIKRDPILTIIIEKNTPKLKEAIQIFEERYTTEIVEFRTFRRVGADTVHAHLFEPVDSWLVVKTSESSPKPDVDIGGPLSAGIKAALTREKNKASGLTKYTEITVEDLIRAGLIGVGQTIYKVYRGRRIEAKIDNEGSIEIQGTGKKYNSLSSAGIAVTGSSINGWRFWQTVRQNGKKSLMTDIRREFQALQTRNQ